MEKIAELKRAKLLALSLLLVAAAAFITTLFLPQTFWVRGVKAIAEAHGGSAVCQATGRGGSRFVLSWPISAMSGCPET